MRKVADCLDFKSVTRTSSCVTEDLSSDLMLIRTLLRFIHS